MKPELLAPAGTYKNMCYAFAYGADAVYAGQPRYSLRVRNNDFKLENLEKGIQYAHDLGKQFFVASNIAPHNSKVKTYMADMEPVIAMQPDALIMSDPGLIMLVQERWPDATIHLSVQANVVNYAAVKFWHKIGIKRVILSRELSLDEIAEIKQQCPEMEIEVFVHGALCIAYSGRCLLSGYINHRDPNQGSCTNACRWDYSAHKAEQNDSGDILPVQPLPIHPVKSNSVGVQFDMPQLGAGATTDQIYLLQEKGRPGEYMPAFEDEHGTYIMNSKDLRAVQHVQKLLEIGVDSFKIEGRTKSHYYAARTTQVYRQAIDDAVAGKSFDMQLMDDLEDLAHRGYTEGFYRRHVHDEYQNYVDGNSKSGKQKFVGEIIGKDVENNFLLVEVKNHFEKGDVLQLMTPHGNQEFRLDYMEKFDGTETDVAPGSSHQVKIPMPAADVQADFGLLVVNL